MSYPSLSVYRADEETYSGRLPTAWDDVNQFMYDERFIGDQRRVGGEWKGGSGFWIRDAACVLCVDNMPANKTIFKMQYISESLEVLLKKGSSSHSSSPTALYQIALYIQTGQIRMSWLDIGDWATKNKTIVGLSHGSRRGGRRTRYDGLDLSSSIGCIDNANCTVIDEIREPYGPTRPTTTLPHPHVGAPVGNPAYAGFCEFGCAAFYFNGTVAGCRKVCQDHVYVRRDAQVLGPSRSSALRVLRRVFRGNLKMSTGSLLPATRDHAPLPAGQVPGRRLPPRYQMRQLPPRAVREDEGGRFMVLCVKCEPGRFNVNVGSASKFDCLRCPPGRFANEPGMKRKCKCMNQYDGYWR